MSSGLSPNQSQAQPVDDSFSKTPENIQSVDPLGETVDSYEPQPDDQPPVAPLKRIGRRALSIF